MTSNRDLMRKCFRENFPHRCPSETPFPLPSGERGCRKFSHCMRMNRRYKDGQVD